VSTILDRVVCGVDASEAGAVAARQAARFAAPAGSLVLVSVDDPSVAVHAGRHMAAVAEELLHDAEDALERGRLAALPFHPAETRLVEGDPLHALLGEIARRDATLAVVGSHGRPRVVGIALGSVTTHLLHEAPCSVLVCRTPRDPEAWPRSIVVGVDGSEQSAAAHAVALELSERFDAHLRAVVAVGDTHVDVEAAREIAPEVEELPRRAVHELHVLSESADLVVVGSRRLRGIRALRSVGEQVAHDARCSVLVVRAGGRSR
jgi:nucleotide-binding universal stress UspA family protein